MATNKLYNYTVSSNGQTYQISNYLPPDQFSAIAAQNGLQITQSSVAPPPSATPVTQRSNAGQVYSNPNNLPRLLIVDPSSHIVESGLVDGTDPRHFGSVQDFLNFQRDTGETQSIPTHDGASAIRVARMWTGDQNYSGYPNTPNIQGGSPAARGVDFNDWYALPISKGGGGSGGSINNPSFDANYDSATSPYPTSYGNPPAFSPFFDPALNPSTTTTWPYPGTSPGGGSAGGTGTGTGTTGTSTGITTAPLPVDDFDKLLKDITSSSAGVRDTTKGLIQLNLSRIPSINSIPGRINGLTNQLVGMMNSSQDNRDKVLASLTSETDFQKQLHTQFNFSIDNLNAQLGRFANPAPGTMEYNLQDQFTGNEKARLAALERFGGQGSFENLMSSLAGTDRANRDYILQQLYGPGSNEENIKQLIDKTQATRDAALSQVVNNPSQLENQVSGMVGTQATARQNALDQAFTPMMQALQGYYDRANLAEGMSPQEKTAMQTQASDSIAQNFLNARQELNKQLLRSGAMGGGETGRLPGDEGAITTQYGNLLAQQAAAQSQATTGINLQDAQRAFQTLMANRQLGAQAVGQGTNIFNSAAQAYSPTPLIGALSQLQQNRIGAAGTYGNIFNPSQLYNDLAQQTQNRIAASNVYGNIFNPATDVNQQLQGEQNRLGQLNTTLNAFSLDPIMSGILGLANNRLGQANLYSSSYANQIPTLANAILGQQQLGNQTAQTYSNIYDPTAYIPGLTNFTSQLPGAYNAGTSAFSTAGGNANTLAELDPTSFKNIALASLLSTGANALTPNNLSTIFGKIFGKIGTGTTVPASPGGPIS